MFIWIALLPTLVRLRFLLIHNGVSKVSDKQKEKLSQLRSLYRLLETVDFDPIRVRDIYWNRKTNQQNLNSIRQLASLDSSSLANLMPTGCVEGNGPYLLFGRELIQLFDIIVHGDKVSQGCKVLNDEVKLLEEFLETDEFEELQDAADSIRSDTESGRKVLYITGRSVTGMC